MKGDEPNFQARSKRKLSRFLARKMLYDFICGRLDSARIKAVEEFIGEDWETRTELEYIQGGLKYCGDLSLTRISEPLMQEIREHKGFWVRVRTGHWWRDWPESIKWGMEAAVLSGVAALVAMWIPWSKVAHLLPSSRDEVILVEIDKDQKPAGTVKNGAKSLSDQGEGRALLPVAVGKDASTLNPSPHETFGEKESGSTEGSTKGSAKEVAETRKSSIQPSKVAEDEEVGDPVQGVRGGSESETAEPQENIIKGASSLKGFVYRAFMSLDQLDQVSPKIVAEIKQLNGAKAGQVELGWRKPKGSYFHFSLPESNYEKLMSALKSFGPVRIYKDPHWRVMPQGQIRFILWVEDNQVKK